MKISTRGEYGLRALMELGMEPDKGLSLRDIAKRQNISMDYLEQIVPALKSAGLVKAKRGAQGGYQLAKTPLEITMFDALRALEGPFEPMICLSEDEDAKTATKPSKNSNCGASGSCAVQEVWRELQEAIEKVLKNLTLAEMLNRQEKLYGVPIRTYRERELTRLVVL
ncbi:RrF2 family transcriptional regulator [Abditibacterium utsteinense]|nr:Rrf2 family transcriptional regulator [Abditibacterium utsteinense]